MATGSCSWLHSTVNFYSVQLGPWQLEYAIAQRYLNELSLLIERILPHACHIYQWAMPAELWLSSNPARVPTRVCVMAILILALRVQYNINGQGIWEVSIPDRVTVLSHVLCVIKWWTEVFYFFRRFLRHEAMQVSLTLMQTYHHIWSLMAARVRSLEQENCHALLQMPMIKLTSHMVTSSDHCIPSASLFFLVIYTCRVSLVCCPFSGSYTTSYLWKTCSSSLP
jgi:hypothetical protein